jgi:outer membrane lipoprotein LolB
VASTSARRQQIEPVSDTWRFRFISDEQKVYARFFWQQTGQDRYRLLLTNPLGSTELELNAQPGAVELVDNKGKRYTSTDAEEMIGKLTGMPIPLNSLRQWILGLPGDATDYKLDDQYRLSELNYSQGAKTGKWCTAVMTAIRSRPCPPVLS